MTHYHHHHHHHNHQMLNMQLVTAVHHNHHQAAFVLLHFSHSHTSFPPALPSLQKRRIAPEFNKKAAASNTNIRIEPPQVLQARLKTSTSGSWRRTSKTPISTTSRVYQFGGSSAVFTSFCSLQTSAAMEPQVVAQADDDISHLSHIFEPIKGGDRDILMIFAPGGLKPSESYFPLVSEVQAQLSLRLWVVVLYSTDQLQDVLTPAKVEASFPGILRRLQEKSFRSGSFEIENIFFAGHSWGAWQSRSVAVRKAQGFIQLGSWFDPEQDDLAEHPKPVLTVGGEVDGQTVVAISANEASEVLTTELNLGKYNTYAVKPVVIIPKMNHGNFADGKVNFAAGDLDADIPYDTAVRRTAELIAAFLSVQVEGPKSDAGCWGFLTLKEAVTETHRRYRAFWEALQNQAAEAVTVQLQIASLPKLMKENVRVVGHKFVDNFVISKPWIASDKNEIASDEKNFVFVHVHLSKYGHKGLSNLWIKCKSREALTDVFGPDNATASGTYELLAMGKELNAKVFDRALSLVPDDARERYDKRGRKIRFVDDRIVRGPATEWIASDLGFTLVKDGESEIVEVQTPVLISPKHGIAARFAGMHYMKLLTLARAMQWIMVDCLRQDSSRLTVFMRHFN